MTVCIKNAKNLGAFVMMESVLPSEDKRVLSLIIDSGVTMHEV